MTKIYHVIEDTCYQQLTHGLAIPNFCKQKGFECKTYGLGDWTHKRIETDSSPDAVFIIEQAFHNHGGWSAAELRTKVPNGKIVVFGGDTIYYLANRETLGFNPYEVDLWLDTMESVSHFMRDIGVKSDVWWWSVSEEYIRRCEAFAAANKFDKSIDAICLMTVNTDYRDKLVNHLKAKDLSVLIGYGVLSSHDEQLFAGYARSWVALGTTSPAWTGNIRTMKGFRDWFAPFLGTALIYDNHPQMMRFAQQRFGFSPPESLPIYEYDDFDDLVNAILDLKEDKVLYDYIVECQKSTARAISLERQYDKLLKKFDIIPYNFG